MILHLLDDEKVVNRVVESFDEALPGRNRYVCFLNTERSTLVKPGGNIFFYHGTEALDIPFSEVEKVVIHFLGYNKIIFCKRYIPSGIPVFWILWGADLYNALLGNRGYKILSSRRFYPLMMNLRYIVGRMGYSGKVERTMLDFIAHKVNYFVANCIEEYYILQKYFPQHTKHIKHKDFFYYPIDQILNPKLMNVWAKGNNILLGNSASFTNNHEYVLKILTKLDLNRKKVIAPVSYGGSLSYRMHINKVGTRLLGESFQTLESFLPLEEYNSLMASAEICVYGNWRQEAMGNIIIALYLGAKVFLSGHSPLLPWFKEMGISIFELESITNDDLSSPLDENLRKRNREILLNKYSKKNQIRLIKETFGK